MSQKSQPAKRVPIILKSCKRVFSELKICVALLASALASAKRVLY